MFGAELESAEEGRAFFRDDQAGSFVHRVEWSTAEPVTIRSIVLRATHDGNQQQRSFTSFTLKGETESGDLKTLYTFEPPLPYGYALALNELILCDDIADPALMSHYVAEFVQNGGFQFPGPRIVELDGYATNLPAEATPTPAVTVVPPSTAGPTVVPPTPAPVATSSPTSAPSAPSGGGGDTTLLIGVGALIVAAVVGLWLILSRRRRREDRPRT